jgi:hypothetical protein
MLDSDDGRYFTALGQPAHMPTRQVPALHHIYLQVTDTDRAAFLELGATSDFEPTLGREMKGYWR